MKQILSLVLSLDGRLKLKFLFLFIAVIGLGIINTISVFSIAPVVDVLLDKDPYEVSIFTKIMANILNIESFDLISSFIFFGSIILLAGLASIGAQYFVLNIKYASVTAIMGKAYNQFFKAKYLFFSQSDIGVLLNSFQRECEKIAITMQNVARFMNYFVQILIYLALPLYISPTLTVIFIFASLVFCSPILILNRKVHPMGVEETSTFNKVSSILNESFSASKLILAYGRQNNAVKKYLNSYKDHAKITVPLQLIIFAINIMIMPLGMLSALLAIYWGYITGVNLAEITMILFAFFRMLPLLGQLSQTRSEIISFLPALEQLEDLTNRAKDYEESQSGDDFTDLKDKITFKDISLSYPDGTEALKNINISFKKNKRIAIVGPSGSGKTSIADILMGLYEPSSGHIKIDEYNFSEFNLSSYRNKIAYVPQEPFLFNDTIRNNMLWSKPDASDNEIWKALEKSNAVDFVKDTKDSLDTKVGDRGGRLSGGQRQRISLARAIVRKPCILILDESTSSLDTESEKFIQDSIEQLSKDITVVTIAHRLSTIKNADIVYVMKSGTIIENGDYDTLIKDENSKLSNLVKAQNSKNEIQ